MKENSSLKRFGFSKASSGLQDGKTSVNHIYQPLHSDRIWHKVNFKRSLTGLNSEFLSPRLVASPRLKNLVCPTIYPYLEGEIIGFIPFPRVLVLCNMQSVSSRIWTRVAVSISYDNNLYTTGTSKTSVYRRKMDVEYDTITGQKLYIQRKSI